MNGTLWIEKDMKGTGHGLFARSWPGASEDELRKPTQSAFRNVAHILRWVSLDCNEHCYFELLNDSGHTDTYIRAQNVNIIWYVHNLQM